MFEEAICIDQTHYACTWAFTEIFPRGKICFLLIEKNYEQKAKISILKAKKPRG
jgi:hypothetical protein